MGKAKRKSEIDPDATPGLQLLEPRQVDDFIEAVRHNTTAARAVERALSRVGDLIARYEQDHAAVLRAIERNSAELVTAVREQTALMRRTNGRVDNPHPEPVE